MSTVRTLSLLNTAPAVELPAPSLAELTTLLDAAGLTGRGGGGFPSATKLRSLAGRGGVVVGNAMEGEPLSKKDAVLVASAPHLVAEGLAVVGRAVGASRAVLAVGSHLPTGPVAPFAARRGIEVVPLGGGFVAGQESALVNALSGRAGVPSDPLVRVTTRGVDGRPTAVLNAETLAHVALLARFGPTAWPDSRLCTLSGAVARPGVVEAAATSTLRDVVECGAPGPFRAVLVGGYHGAWLAPSELDVPVGATRIGAGVLHVLGTGTCPLAATADVAGYLAGQSARQCGPCVNALPRMVDTLRRLAQGARDAGLPAEVARLSALASGRGACAHPDGTVRMVASAMTTFADDVAAHLAGGCVTR